MSTVNTNRWKFNPFLSSFVIGILGTFICSGFAVSKSLNFGGWVLSLLVLLIAVACLLINLLAISTFYSRESGEFMKSEILFQQMYRRKVLIFYFVYRAFNRMLFWFVGFILLKLLFMDLLPSADRIRIFLLGGMLFLICSSSFHRFLKYRKLKADGAGTYTS